MLDASWLPAEKVADGVGTEAVDAIEIHAPLGAGGYRLSGYGFERDAGGGVPDFVGLIDFG